MMKDKALLEQISKLEKRVAYLEKYHQWLFTDLFLKDK